MSPLVRLLLYLLLESFLICVVFVALCDIARRVFKLDEFLTFCAGVTGLGVTGYLMFWLAFANYAVFSVAKAAVLAALLIHFCMVVYRGRLGAYRWLAEPLIFTVLFFLLVTALGFANGGLEDPLTAAQTRFTHAMPPDNVLPMLVAFALSNQHIPSPLIGDWMASDRPPLQTGLYLLLCVRNFPIPYQIISAWLQATFLFGVWGLVFAAGLPVAARRLVLLACCLLPVSIINTFYVWPKLLAVGYLLLLFALLFCRPARNDAGRKLIGVLIGGLAGLSVLSHGTSFFVLIGFAVTVLVFWAWPSPKTMIWGAATLVALYVPWMLFQRFFDPPGNRLMKWHLAGVTEVDGRGILETLRDSYGALTWHDYLQGKLINITTMIGSWPRSLMGIVTTVTGQDTVQATGVRIVDFFQLLPSLHFFSIALICAFAGLALMRPEHHPQRQIALRMLVAVAASSAAFVILIFTPGQTINHIGSYATPVMLTAFAFMVLSLCAPMLAIVFILVQTASIATIYAFLLPHDPAMWVLWLIAAAAAAALFANAFAPRFARN